MKNNFDLEGLQKETRQLAQEIDSRKKQLAELSDVKKEIKEFTVQREEIKKEIKTLDIGRTQFIVKTEKANRVCSNKELEIAVLEKAIARSMASL